MHRNGVHAGNHLSNTSDANGDRADTAASNGVPNGVDHTNANPSENTTISESGVGREPVTSGEGHHFNVPTSQAPTSHAPADRTGQDVGTGTDSSMETPGQGNPQQVAPTMHTNGYGGVDREVNMLAEAPTVSLQQVIGSGSAKDAPERPPAQTQHISMP